MSYIEDLNKAYAEYNRGAVSSTSRIDFLGNALFGFAVNNNYDILEAMSYYAINIIAALNVECVGPLIREENYRFWFTILRNTKFFEGRVAWGGNDNFGWDEDHKYVIQDVDMYIKGKHALDPVELTHEEWKEFMQAVVRFAQPEMQTGEKRIERKRFG